MPEIDFFQLTDAGCVADANEDAVGRWPHEDGLVFAVADGSGEHGVGAVASHLALDVLAREIERAPGSWDVAKRLRRAAQEANLALYNKVIAVPELRGMAATLTVSALVGGTLVAAHVGLARLLLWRDGRLTQLTKDHSWLSEESARPPLSIDGRDGTARALGRELIVSIDVLTLPIRAGDVLLQCSDGVHAALREQELGELLAAHPPEPACRALVRRAREEGGEDNLSVQVAAVMACPPAAHTWWRLGR